MRQYDQLVPVNHDHSLALTRTGCTLKIGSTDRDLALGKQHPGSVKNFDGIAGDEVAARLSDPDGQQ